MPVWVWVLLVLAALGFVLWLLDERMGLPLRIAGVSEAIVYIAELDDT